MIKFPWIACVALVAGLSTLPACDTHRNARTAAEAAKTSAATLEQVFSGKTPGGKPVRVYKIGLQAPNGEHLLMVVGDSAAAVTIKNASTVVVSGQEFSDPSYLPTGNGLVFAVKTSGSQFLAMPFRSSGEFNDPNMTAPDAKPAFPMALFKAKVKGETLDLPALDTL